jgi:hypothetical protein
LFISSSNFFSSSFTRVSSPLSSPMLSFYKYLTRISQYKSYFVDVFLAILTINSQIILVTAPQMYRIVTIHSTYIRLTHSTHCFIFSLIQRTKTHSLTKIPCASLPFSWKTKPTQILVLVLSVYFGLRNVYCSKVRSVGDPKFYLKKLFLLV